ncbi:MAG: hypothetical protein KJ970_09735 [Candidatus Eisenbacteria bacterium]|uniref:Uncharacterized protein n=1 Tax=Eiseniibacteriota bacterium TaxID=2212470 RepID=A0A948RX74_UNCEI|nr:hypothetical protein [Candidatus Eisenbacteria bacterium]MBU1949399.1 hypothetical protein [Candidatus Eisenbacteria bacterium]MBU2691198.1 hypothetical protein [Candidatus Eisenbacteria bacterium]
MMNPFKNSRDHSIRSLNSHTFFLAALPLCLLIAMTASAQELPLRIEAESLIDYEDLDNPLFCPDWPDMHASNLLAVDGFNRPGQWCDYELMVEQPICFVDYIGSAGSLGLIREYYISYRTYEHEILVTDTLVTIPGLSEGT